MILKLKWCLIVSANHTRFTKRHFVRHKNTQKLEEAYIIQFLFLSLNMESVFKFIQWPQNGGHLSFSVFFAPHRPVNKQNVRGDENKNIAREVAWLLTKVATIWNMEDKQKKSSIKFLKKMKNGIHLEVAEFSKLKPNYLNSVKKVGLGKQFQVSGDFCLEQTSFLWIVNHYL